MKLNLIREKFLKAWQIAERVAGNKTSGTKAEKDLGSTILFTASEDGILTLEATDLKTSSVKCIAQGVEVIEKGSAVIPVSVAGSLIKKSQDENITLEVNEERGIIISGKNRTRFSTPTINDFPEIPRSENGEFICRMALNDFIRLINEGSSASPKPTDFPKYIGTCLLRTSAEEKIIKSISTDGRRLALSEIHCEVTKDQDIILPSPAAKDLIKNLPAEKVDCMIDISTDGDTAWFSVDNTEFSVRLVETSFPAYERILSDTNKTTMIISRTEFLAALDRIEVIARENVGNVASLILEPEKNLVLTAKAVDHGTASELLKAEISGSIMQIGFSVGLLQDGLQVLGQGDVKIEFSGQEEQARLYRSNDDSFLYMLMPARLSREDILDEEEIKELRPDLVEKFESEQNEQAVNNNNDNNNNENNNENNNDNNNDSNPEPESESEPGPENI